MNTWVRTGLAIITAGSISLALAACGSKEGDTGGVNTDQSGQIPQLTTKVTAEMLNGPWIPVIFDGKDQIDGKDLNIDENNNIFMWIIKDDSIAYTYARNKDEDYKYQCDDIKDLFAEVKNGGFWDNTESTEEYYAKHTYGKGQSYKVLYDKIHDTTKFDINSKQQYVVSMDTKTNALHAQNLKAESAEDIREEIWMRPDQGKAKVLVSKLCGDDIPQWK